MDLLAELAGFFAAHSVWCVSEGEILTPLLAQEKANGKRELFRFESREYGDAVAQGKKRLDSIPKGILRAVFVFDGFINLKDGKTDALVLEAREFVPAPRSIMLAVPYRSARSNPEFAVYRPKFLEFKGDNTRGFPAEGSSSGNRC